MATVSPMDTYNIGSRRGRLGQDWEQLQAKTTYQLGQVNTQRDYGLGRLAKQLAFGQGQQRDVYGFETGANKRSADRMADQIHDQYLRTRNLLPGSLAGRGVVNSGIRRQAMRELLEDRNRQVGDVRFQETERAKQLDFGYQQALAQMAFEDQLNRQQTAYTADQAVSDLLFGQSQGLNLYNYGMGDIDLMEQALNAQIYSDAERFVI